MSQDSMSIGVKNSTEVSGDKILDGLRALRSLYSGPERWTRGTMARDETGKDVRIFSEEARSYCLAGGCIKVGANEGIDLEILKRVGAEAEEAKGVVGPMYWNDKVATFEDVMEAIDKAIVTRMKELEVYVTPNLLTT
jgi:hypothetical protein